MRGSIFIGLLAAAVLMALPDTAGAATTIGSTLARTPEAATCGEATFLNTALPAPAVLAAPYDGVIVDWRAKLAEPGGTFHYRLRVLRPSGKGDRKYTFVESGPQQSLPVAGLNLLSLPQPLPVKAGDVIGYDCPNNAPSPTAGESLLFPGSSTAYFNLIPKDGEVAQSSVPSEPKYGEEEEINADIVGLPSLSEASPARGGARGGSLVSVTGEHLGDLTSATVGGVSAGVASVSESEATLTVPRHGAGKADIQVANAAGGSNVLAGAFEYVGPPAISSFTQRRGKWKPRVGTGLSFTLSEPAIAKLTFEAHPPGKKYKCPVGRRGSRCRFFAAFSLDAQAGTTSVRLHAKIPGTRKRLRPGRYWVTLSATNAFGEASAAKPLYFTVLP